MYDFVPRDQSYICIYVSRSWSVVNVVDKANKVGKSSKEQLRTSCLQLYV